MLTKLDSDKIARHTGEHPIGDVYRETGTFPVVGEEDDQQPELDPKVARHTLEIEKIETMPRKTASTTSISWLLIAIVAVLIALVVIIISMWPPAF